MSLIFGQTIFKILQSSTPQIANIGSLKSFSIFTKKQDLKGISPYIIVRAKQEDFREILKVMHEGYYDGEPTMAALNITPNAVLDERAIHAMTEGFTLVAKCKYNGCIVGACINESTNPWDPDMEEKLACTVECNNVRNLIMFYAHMMRVPDLWRCLGVQKVYEMSYLFVKRPHRKKGLAYRLLEESKSLGADAGFPVIRCDATNVHTAKICERLGMQQVAEIPYCTYLDQKLEPIFKPPWPNDSVKIFCDCSPQYHELKKILQDKKSFAKFRNLKKRSQSKDEHV
ncbi:hypothetical protein HUJ04_006737 [Dendroctonus ponderosae]|uniref:aralkylamine N-acetyltransferase n=2 Tax=Dendroctonus ponderosae TaxID=77166 RepID=A0AAR5Q3U1_DENPD|nr:hypothetical protein HUJ04_006737 [Dendroctonus ponderosae]